MAHQAGARPLVNLILRFVVGIPVLAGLLWLYLMAPWYFPASLMGLLGLCGLYEYRALLAGAPGIALPATPLLALALLMMGGGMLAGPPGLTAMLFVATGGWLLLCLLRNQSDHPRWLQQAGLGLIGLVWIGWFMSHWILLLRHEAQGNAWAVFLLMVLAGNDTGAYVIGSLIGRHRLIPEISPNKTAEGSIGGIVGAMVGALLVVLWLPGEGLGLSLAHLLALCVPLALLGQAGDLLESLLKRLAGVKSSGVFLPGHGGFLDRLDSLLLATPFLYYYLTLVQP